MTRDETTGEFCTDSFECEFFDPVPFTPVPGPWPDVVVEVEPDEERDP